MTTCPVCGKPVDESTAPSSEYEGQIFYFACPSCKLEFDEDPQRFATQGPRSRGEPGMHRH